jgi:hypothetical protein
MGREMLFNNFKEGEKKGVLRQWHRGDCEPAADFFLEWQLAFRF